MTTTKRGNNSHYDAAVETVESLRPKKGSGLDSVTLSAGGRSVTLTAESGSAADAVGVAHEVVKGVVQGVKRDVPPRLEVQIPTDIGLVCSTEESRYSLGDVAVMRSLECPDELILAATDGRMLAVVSSSVMTEGDCETAGLVPRWIPAKFARAENKGPRTLRLAHGTPQSLFASTRTWVDDEGGRFDSHPEGGTFPVFGEVLPTTLGTRSVVRLNVALLAKLAKALNSHESDNRDCITIAFPEPSAPGTALDRPIAVVGNAGIGVLMPVKCSAELTREAWIRTRQTFVAASMASPHVGEGKKPADQVGGDMSNGPLIDGDDHAGEAQ